MWAQRCNQPWRGKEKYTDTHYIIVKRNSQNDWDLLWNSSAVNWKFCSINYDGNWRKHTQNWIEVKRKREISFFFCIDRYSRYWFNVHRCKILIFLLLYYSTSDIFSGGTNVEKFQSILLTTYMLTSYTTYTYGCG